MQQHSALLDTLVRAYEDGIRDPSPALLTVFAEFLEALECGALRSAKRQADGSWAVNVPVKQAILVGFRIGRIVDMSGGGQLPFADKDTYPPMREIDLIGRNSRIVPGGSSVRRGAYIGRSVTCMPPMYINVGAYVDDGTMIDSNVLVGSCAYIGKGVHLSAGTQIGGVLEPIGNRPVIIEDDVFVGGSVGIYEGVLVRRRAVLGSGVILNASTPVYDCVHKRILRAGPGAPLEIPEGAVVVPGSRPLGGTFAAQHGLQVACPIIVKYRDEKTDASAALELDLR